MVAVNSDGVTLRPYPYPYRSMLAICSDLDETLDFDAYLETVRFLVTRSATAYGRGLGLEVGNTMYFDMPSGHFSYWSVTAAERDALRQLIRGGFIDCIHSFGDLAQRREAEKALEDLRNHDCRIRVWVDHGVAPTNFGDDIMLGQGDVPGAAAFHADLSMDYGVRYVWCGRVTSVIGQNVPASLGGIWRSDARFASTITVGKELAKRALGAAGARKYRPHAENRLLGKRVLRSGHEVKEFLRCNPHWRGVSAGETGEGLGDVLVPRTLDRLVSRQGVCVLYTHLGKGRDRRRPLGERTVKGLQLLAQAEAEGRILVTTTYRLLRYCDAIERLRWTVERSGGDVEIRVATDDGGETPDGLTFCVPHPERTHVSLNGVRLSVERHAPDKTAAGYVSVPWQRLAYPL
jgi:hypothetical protein